MFYLYTVVLILCIVKHICYEVKKYVDETTCNRADAVKFLKSILARQCLHMCVYICAQICVLSYVSYVFYMHVCMYIQCDQRKLHDEAVPHCMFI